MNRIVRILRTLFRWSVALVLLFEEWGWEPLGRALALLGRLPFFAWIERRIRALPPYAALLVVFLPTLTLLPIKVFAVWLIGEGRAGLGLAVIIVAKVVGTAVLARLFALTRESLMTLPWFAQWYGRWMRWKDALMAQVRASALWRQARRLKAVIRRAFRRAFRTPT